MDDPTRINHVIIGGFISDVLKKEGVDPEIAGHVSRGLVHASLRGVDSHGIRLLPHYLKALKAGRINPGPNFTFHQTTLSSGILDADHTFGHAAGMEAVSKVLELSLHSGLAAVAVKRSSHFGAASFFALEIAKHDRIGMSFTNTNALIIPTAGKGRFLGNNPICFAAPMAGEEPVCLDMATSAVSFNTIMQWREAGIQAPPGTGADRNGEETTDPGVITSLLPTGGYKGYGLSLMVEILCSMLTGMPFGPHITDMYDDPIGEKRNLGHFFTAIKIDAFENLGTFKKRTKQLVEELRREPSKDPHIAVQVAGDPEKKVAEKRTKEGIPLRESDIAFLKELSARHRLPLDGKI